MTSSIDSHHLLIIGAGPGLGASIARRFALGGYRVTLLARSTDKLESLAKGLADGGTAVDTVAADAADPDGLRATLGSLYAGADAPGVLVYHASQAVPDTLLGSDVAALHRAYDVDVVSGVVAAQVAAPHMRAAGGGTILFTGGGFADYPVPALATLSVGKSAMRSAATILGAEMEGDHVRVASITILGAIAAGTPFDPDRIAERYWTIVESTDNWQPEFRFEGS